MGARDDVRVLRLACGHMTKRVTSPVPNFSACFSYALKESRLLRRSVEDSVFSVVPEWNAWCCLLSHLCLQANFPDKAVVMEAASGSTLLCRNTCKGPVVSLACSSRAGRLAVEDPVCCLPPAFGMCSLLYWERCLTCPPLSGVFFFAS